MFRRILTTLAALIALAAVAAGEDLAPYQPGHFAFWYPTDWEAYDVEPGYYISADGNQVVFFAEFDGMDQMPEDSVFLNLLLMRLDAGDATNIAADTFELNGWPALSVSWERASDASPIRYSDVYLYDYDAGWLAFVRVASPGTSSEALDETALQFASNVTRMEDELELPSGDAEASELTAYQTGHFTFMYPTGWSDPAGVGLSLSEDSCDYMLFSETQEDWASDEVEARFAGIVGSYADDQNVVEYSSETFDVNGMPALRVSSTMDNVLSTWHTCMVYVYDGGYLASLTFSSTVRTAAAIDAAAMAYAQHISVSP